ncbi:MAG: ATP-binding protein, partial [Chitinispirillaceae bacterium]
RTDSLVIRAVSGLGDIDLDVRSLIGGDVIGMVFTLEDHVREELRSGKMVEISGGLYDFCFGRFPRSIIGVLEKKWGVKYVYTAGFSRNGKLFGTMAILVENELYDEDMEVLNAFVDQTALAVHRKCTEDRLCESNQRYRTVVESIGTGIAVIDSFFRVDTVNSYMKKWFPKLVDPTGQPCLKVFEPICSSQMCKTCPVSQTFEDGEVHRKIIRMKNSSVPLHMRMVSSPLKDNSGKTTSVVLVVEDVSDYVSHERCQREQIVFLQRLIDSIPNPVFYKDRELKIQGCNASFERFTGYSKEYVVGKTFGELGLEKTAAEALLKERNLLQRPGTQIYETKERCAEGSVRDVVYSKASYCSEDGKASGLVGVIIDITDRVKTERMLAEATRLAQSAVEAKNEFIAGVSHEIRTPLSAILLASEALHRTDLDSENQEYASILHQSAHILMNLVNDVLDFSKMQSGKMVVEKEVFNLRNLTDEIVRSFSLQAEAKGIKLAVDHDRALPFECIGDSGKIRQVLSNLFSNALKFTSSGRILLTVKQVRKEDKTFDVLFSVSDTGMGINSDKHDLVFDSFVQADGAVGKKYGGTGLGLSICKRLVELMGGKIWLESEVGEGSTFHFQIKLEEHV